MTPWEEKYAEALRPVLKSREPRRFRLLRVVCDQDHKLLDVYQTALGQVYVGEVVPLEPSRAFGPDWEVRDPVRMPRSASVEVIGLVGYLPPGPTVGNPDGQRLLDADRRRRQVIEVTCNHGHHRTIRMAWLEQKLSEGKPRVVWQYKAVQRPIR